MPLQIEIDPTPLSLDASGTVRVSGTRVALESLLWLHQQGYPAEAIHGSFPSVPLSDVHAVIAYYLWHKSAVDQYLEQRKIEAEAIREHVERNQRKGPTKAELLARWAAKYGGNKCSGS